MSSARDKSLRDAGVAGVVQPPPSARPPVCDHCGERCNRLFIVLATNAHEPGVRHSWNFCSSRCLVFWMALADATDGWLRDLGGNRNAAALSQSPAARSVAGPSMEDIACESPVGPTAAVDQLDDLYFDDFVRVF